MEDALPQTLTLTLHLTLTVTLTLSLTITLILTLSLTLMCSWAESRVVFAETVFQGKYQIGPPTALSFPWPSTLFLSTW